MIKSDLVDKGVEGRRTAREFANAAYLAPQYADSITSRREIQAGTLNDLKRAGITIKPGLTHPQTGAKLDTELAELNLAAEEICSYPGVDGALHNLARESYYKVARHEASGIVRNAVTQSVLECFNLELPSIIEDKGDRISAGTARASLSHSASLGRGAIVACDFENFRDFRIVGLLHCEALPASRVGGDLDRDSLITLRNCIKDHLSSAWSERHKMEFDIEYFAPVAPNNPLGTIEFQIRIVLNDGIVNY